MCEAKTLTTSEQVIYFSGSETVKVSNVYLSVEDICAS